MKKFSIGKIIYLHLVPGICMLLGILILDYFIPETILPRFLIFIISSICILAPIEIGLIQYYNKDGKSKKPIDFPKEKKQHNWKQTIIFSLVSIFWAIFIFGVFGSLVNDYIKETLFFWLPDAFNIGDYIENSQIYSKTILITSYFSGLLVVGVIIPIIEELYFRGFLLPRMDNGKFTAPFIETVLFAAYHLWSPWMIPIRIVAIFPMTYFVSQKKNIYIGIITHVFLNIIGDFIHVVPIIFN